MKKNIILGLDIGTNSVGWAVVETTKSTDSESSLVQVISLLQSGVRIIPSDDNIRNFEQGKPATKNTERRQLRGIRKIYRRYRQRREKLKNLLAKHGLSPTEELFRLTAKELLELRVKALTKKISLPELGRLIFWLNQKRGYKSNRLVDIDVEDEPQENAKQPTKEPPKKNLTTQMSEISKTINQDHLTIGQYLLKRYKDNDREPLKSNIPFLRSDFEVEFDRIWDTQAKFYPKILKGNSRMDKESLKDTLYKSIKYDTIYYQRPLKSQKKSVGFCRFSKGTSLEKETGELKLYPRKVCPQSSPYFQEFRIWQQINNLTIVEKETTHSRTLKEEDKQNLYRLLTSKQELSEKEILKLFGYSQENYEINLTAKKLLGNQTTAKLKSKFDTHKYKKADLFLKFNIEQGDEQPLFQLWHLLYAAQDSEKLTQVLQTKFGFPKELAEDLSKITFTKSYASMGTQAIKKMLPHMVKGIKYHEAAQLAGLDHSDPENKRKSDTTQDKLKPIKAGEMRQPVVEQVINQVVNVVNAIMDKYGKPQAIHIELAREMKKNAEQRAKDIKNIATNTRKRELAKKWLIENGITQSLKNIEKCLLWHETKKISVFSGKVISSSDLFGDENKYQIEHIIPKSRFFDDSMANKTLCESYINKEKDKQTAYEYMKQKGNLEEFTKRLFSLCLKKKEKGEKRKDTNETDYNELCGIPYNKIKNRLLAEKIPEDFVNRQLAETRYITREVKTRLGEICPKIVVTSGQITDLLKHSWGLDSVLEELNKEKIKEKIDILKKANNQKTKDTTPFIFSKREFDHRHHALDAIVVACTSQSLIQRYNTLNAKGTTLQKGKDGKTISVYKPPVPIYHKMDDESKSLGAFRKMVINTLANVLVSIKNSQKTLAFQPIKDEKGNYLPQYKTPAARGQLHKETIYRVHWDKTSQKPKRFLERVELNNSFKESWIKDIPDLKIREILTKRLEEYENDPKKAFASDKLPVWFNEEKRIPIKKVRLTINQEPIALRVNSDGPNALLPLEQRPLKDFVMLRNNYMAVIFKKLVKKGEQYEDNIISFYEAVQRKKESLPYYSLEEGETLVMTMRINEMFVFDLDPQETDFKDPSNAALISEHLYRLQKMTKKDYYFRHHLAPTIDYNDFKRITSLNNLISTKCTKVRLNHLGEVVHVGE